MTTPAIESIAALGGTASAGLGAASAAAEPAAGFGTQMMQELDRLNTGMMQTDALVRDYAAGGSVPLHTMMIQLEESRLAFQAVVQVRNKLLEAYQEVMRTQL